MKSVFLTMVSLLLTIPTMASEAPPEFKLTCMTEFPTTSFIVDTHDKTVSLRMVHHHGTKYMPIFQGVVTPSDLNYLNEKSNILPLMGDDITVTWPIENCEVYKGKIMGCYRGKRQKIGQLEVSTFSFNTREVDTRTLDYTFNEYHVNFSVIVDSFNHDITMEYQMSDCLFN